MERLFLKEKHKLLCKMKVCKAAHSSINNKFLKLIRSDFHLFSYSTTNCSAWVEPCWWLCETCCWTVVVGPLMAMTRSWKEPSDCLWFAADRLPINKGLPRFSQANDGLLAEGGASARLWILCLCVCGVPAAECVPKFPKFADRVGDEGEERIRFLCWATLPDSSHRRSLSESLARLIAASDNAISFSLVNFDDVEYSTVWRGVSGLRVHILIMKCNYVK